MFSKCNHSVFTVLQLRDIWKRAALSRPMDGRFGHGRFGQDVLATDVLATYIEKTDVLAKSIIYVLIIDIKATNIFNLLI